MTRLFALAAVLLLSTPAGAADTATTTASPASDAVKVGKTLRDAGNVRLGKIDRVYDDGSVRIIFGDRFVVIPADKLTVSGDEVTTSLTKREVSRI
jgi:ribosomal protein L13